MQETMLAIKEEEEKEAINRVARQRNVETGFPLSWRAFLFSKSRNFVFSLVISRQTSYQNYFLQKAWSSKKIASVCCVAVGFVTTLSLDWGQLHISLVVGDLGPPYIWGLVNWEDKRRLKWGQSVVKEGLYPYFRHPLPLAQHWPHFNLS